MSLSMYNGNEGKSGLLVKGRAIIIVIVLLVTTSHRTSSQNDLSSLRTCDSVNGTNRAVAYDKVLLEQAWILVEQRSASINPVVVGMLERGIDTAHQEFNQPLVAVRVISRAAQDYEHGTIVAAIVGANSRMRMSVDCSIRSEASQMSGILGGVVGLDYRLSNVFVPFLREPTLRLRQQFEESFAAALRRLDQEGATVVAITLGTPSLAILFSRAKCSYIRGHCL